MPVTSADDIFFALGIKPPETAKIRQFQRQPARPEKYLQLILDGISDQEELALAAKLDGPTISQHPNHAGN